MDKSCNNCKHENKHSNDYPCYKCDTDNMWEPKVKKSCDNCGHDYRNSGIGKNTCDGLKGTCGSPNWGLWKPIEDKKALVERTCDTCGHYKNNNEFGVSTCIDNPITFKCFNSNGLMYWKPIKKEGGLKEGDKVFFYTERVYEKIMKARVTLVSNVTGNIHLNGDEFTIGGLFIREPDKVMLWTKERELCLKHKTYMWREHHDYASSDKEKYTLETWELMKRIEITRDEEHPGHVREIKNETIPLGDALQEMRDRILNVEGNNRKMWRKIAELEEKIKKQDEMLSGYKLYANNWLQRLQDNEYKTANKDHEHHLVIK